MTVHKTTYKWWWIGILFFSILVSCQPRFGLKTGDLIFKFSSEDAFSKAISDATSLQGQDFDHVGILYYRGDSLYVIEATPSAGVTLTDWETFRSTAPVVGGTPGLVAKRLTEPYPIEETIHRALSHLGEPYDWYFLPDNGRMYCSELVYESYLDLEGKHLFSAKPMNFLDKDGALPQFWSDLFSELDMPVPQDSLGTNPNDMANEPILRLLPGRYLR